MIVAGGTYREDIVVPAHHEELGGSGYRAAVALPANTVTLVTAAEQEFAPVLGSACEIMQVSVAVAERDKAVGFDYFAPFTPPTVRGGTAQFIDTQQVRGEQALIFGIVERGSRAFELEQVVFDPQTVSDPSLEQIAELKVRSRIICANATEVRSIGTSDDIETAARGTLSRMNADAVIVKAGAGGCLVIEKHRPQAEWVGATPTRTVWKLGSGDVFSAGFAYAHFAGASIIDSARVGSASAAWWCATKFDRVPLEIITGKPYEIPGATAALDNAGRRPRIYLAAPFFTVAERWLVDACLAFLTEAGADVFSPVHRIGLGGPEVAAADLAGLDDCDAVFALLDGWDPGTLFECGWANHKGIPVVGVASNLNHVGSTMLHGTGAELHTDVTTALYRSIWVALGAPRTEAK